MGKKGRVPSTARKKGKGTSKRRGEKGENPLYHEVQKGTSQLPKKNNDCRKRPWKKKRIRSSGGGDKNTQHLSNKSLKRIPSTPVSKKRRGTAWGRRLG